MVDVPSYIRTKVDHPAGSSPSLPNRHVPATATSGSRPATRPAARRSRPRRSGRRRRRSPAGGRSRGSRRRPGSGRAAGARRRSRPRCRGGRPTAIRTPAPIPALTTIAGKPGAPIQPTDEVDGRRRPLRRVDPDQLDDDPGSGSSPDGDQERVRPRAVEDEDGERRHGAGDQQEDHRVVEAPHPAADLGTAPVDSVIESADPEQRRQRRRVDRDGDASRAAWARRPPALRPAPSETKNAHSWETPRSRGFWRAMNSAAAASRRRRPR